MSLYGSWHFGFKNCKHQKLKIERKSEQEPQQQFENIVAQRLLLMTNVTLMIAQRRVSL